MTSTLRPLTPPWALMSSAAMLAALVSEAPATADSSPITPILIGSLVWPAAERAEHTNTAAVHRAAPAISPGKIPFGGAPPIVLCMLSSRVPAKRAASGSRKRLLPVVIRLQERPTADKRAGPAGVPSRRAGASAVRWARSAADARQIVLAASCAISWAGRPNVPIGWPRAGVGQ